MKRKPVAEAIMDKAYKITINNILDKTWRAATTQVDKKSSNIHLPVIRTRQALVNMCIFLW